MYSNQKKMDKDKIKVKVSEDNVFNMLGICTSALKKEGKHEESKELIKRIFSSHSYDESLSIIKEYCYILNKTNSK